MYTGRGTVTVNQSTGNEYFNNSVSATGFTYHNKKLKLPAKFSMGFILLYSDSKMEK